MSKSRKPRLGRGLSSLMAEPAPVSPGASGSRPAGRGEGAGGGGGEPPADRDARRPVDPAASPEGGERAERAERAEWGEGGEGGLNWIEVDRIEPNPYQPRRGFDEEALDQLAHSIQRDGVMQPIVVRRGEGENRYQLVAGERRWRAARKAGLARLPAVLRDLDDRKLAEWAVIENLQREDLNPIERAEAFARLIDRFKVSHQDVAERVGVNRSTITNVIRLLDLPEDVREWVRRGELSAGHGRALLGVDDAEARLALAKRALADGWPVRRVEEEVRRANQPADAPPGKPSAGTKSTHLTNLQEQIQSQLHMKVKLRPGRKKNTGTLAIEFHDLDQFDALLEKLGVDVD